MKIRPTHDRVAIRVEDDPAESNLVITQTKQKELRQYGTVFAVGDGRKTSKGVLVPPDVEIGDKVIFKKFMAEETMDIDGHDCIVIKPEQIIVVLGKGE